VPRKPGMTRDDLFKVNAGIVKGLAEAVASTRLGPSSTSFQTPSTLPFPSWLRL